MATSMSQSVDCKICKEEVPLVKRRTKYSSTFMFTSIFKRATSQPSCPNNIPITLCEGKISKSIYTDSSVRTEAYNDKSSALYQEYKDMERDQNKHRKLLNNGTVHGLNTDETEAVYLYTTYSYGLHDEFNTGLREGNNRYPVLHYYLDMALKRLPRSEAHLFRGYKRRFNINIGTTLHLPGFSSSSTHREVAEGRFSSPGCTILRFDSSKQAGDVYDLSAIPTEFEYLIPPTELFQVYKNESWEGGYHYIYLKPMLRKRRDTTVFTLCGGCGAQTYSPILIAIILIHRFFIE